MNPTKQNTMEAIYLQSMTDFVLEIDKEWENPSKPFSENKALMKICNYATFLKQPLKLGFFVPCDENGNVLDDKGECSCAGNTEWCHGCNSWHYHNDTFTESDAYLKAKERVLFKGFEYEKTGYGKWSSFMLTCGNYGIQEEFKKPKTIEQFMRSAGFPIELTETAIKQIGL